MIMMTDIIKPCPTIAALRYWMFVILTISSCEDKVITKNTQEMVLAKLASAWQCERATVDGVDRTNIYPGLRITFDAKTYTTANGSPIFMPSGTWNFVNEVATRVTLDGHLQADIKFVTDDILELSLQWDRFSFEPGRLKSVTGNHVFRLQRIP